MPVFGVKLKAVKVFVSVAMSNDWIDAEGYRANVGIILAGADGKLMLAGRVGRKGWQFPQGGVLVDEDPEEAMYRELREEVGLDRADVELLGVTAGWLRYRLPDKFIRRNSKPFCIGQKQRWFMLSLVSSIDNVRFDLGEQPEFDRIRWVDYWRPVNELPPRPRWWPKRWRAVFDKDLAGKDRD